MKLIAEQVFYYSTIFLNPKKKQKLKRNETGSKGAMGKEELNGSFRTAADVISRSKRQPIDLLQILEIFGSGLFVLLFFFFCEKLKSQLCSSP